MSWDWSPETITAIATVAIAVIAFGVAFFEAHTIRKHNQLSVKPLLVIASERITIGDKYGTNFYLHNVGFGPAIIEKYSLFLDDKEFAMKSYEAMTGLERQFPPQFPFDVLLCPTPRESIIAAGQKLMFLAIKIADGGYDELNMFTHRLGIKVEYKTIYEKKEMFIRRNYLDLPREHTPQEKQRKLGL